MIKELEPMVAPAPNLYGVPTRYPFQIADHVFWNEDGHLRCRPIIEPASFISGDEAVIRLFACIKIEASTKGGEQ